MKLEKWSCKYGCEIGDDGCICGETDGKPGQKCLKEECPVDGWYDEYADDNNESEEA